MSAPKPILIAGPTASGKSSLALALAERTGGMLINADSQQIFREWQTLSARPSDAETARAPHHLYGHISLASEYSVGHWLRDLRPILRAAQDESVQTIIVGGTGLYFRALTEGLVEIPPTPDEIRARGEQELDRLGLRAFTQSWAARDPKTAAQTDLDNPRRVLRAWEVLETTGQGLAHWRAATPPPLIPLGQALAIALVPPRDWLYARCEQRFDQMITAGALDEVRHVQATYATLPDLKAVGARELLAHLSGELTLDDAIGQAKTETRRYAKRQLTWIRNQMGDWQTKDPSHPSDLADIMRIVLS
ncbi:MAG: tRNA (adenosine(37)-N6)-dimethylallyltransferase MiaA [Pseudomonadota bacterium]